MHKEPTTRQTGAFNHVHRCYGHSALTLQGRQQLDCPFLSSFFLFLKKNTTRTLLVSTRNVPLGPPSHMVTASSRWHPATNCCSITRGDWKQTLVAANEHPAIHVLQIERMTEEHRLYCDMLLFPNGVWQGSDNGRKKREVLLGFFAKGTTKHCVLY